MFLHRSTNANRVPMAEKAVRDRFLLGEEADKIIQQVTASQVLLTQDAAKGVVAAK